MHYFPNNEIVTAETTDEQIREYYKYFALNATAYVEPSIYATSIMRRKCGLTFAFIYG